MPPCWRSRLVHWRVRLDAQPDEARGHAEMRARRRHRKYMRRLRREGVLA